MLRKRDKSYNRNVLAEGGIVRQYYDNGNFHAVSHTSAPSTTGTFVIERMCDELTPKTDRSTGYCLHKSCVEVVHPFSATVENNCTPGYYQIWENMNILLSEVIGRGVTNYPTVGWIESTLLPSILDSGFNSQAWTSMKPDLEGDVSLTNFLLELSDLKYVARLFAPGSDLLKRISEGHLNWSFGIKPMIRDVSEIYNSLFNLEKRLNDFVKRARTEQKRRYRYAPVTEHQTGSKYVLKSGGCTFWYTTWDLNYTLWQAATMQYEYALDEVSPLLFKLRSLRDILGLRLTPSVIWEAIPFSFVVDWFLNVQDWLESRENPLINPDVIIYDYSLSHKLSFAVKGVFHYPLRTGGWSTHLFHENSGSLYFRRKALPDTNGEPLSFSLPGLNQLMLSASLINVRR